MDESNASTTFLNFVWVCSAVPYATYHVYNIDKINPALPFVCNPPLVSFYCHSTTNHNHPNPFSKSSSNIFIRHQTTCTMPNSCQELRKPHFSSPTVVSANTSRRCAGTMPPRIRMRHDPTQQSLRLSSRTSCPHPADEMPAAEKGLWRM